MEYDSYRSLFSRRTSLRHQLMASLQSYGDDGRLAFQGEEKSPSPERLHLSIKASRSLWKD